MRNSDKKLDRNEILQNNDLLDVCTERGLEFKRMGGELYSKCPFHNDGGRPNFRVNLDKQLWHCDVCGFGGSVIDFISKLENISPAEAMAQLSGVEWKDKRETQKPASKPVVSSEDLKEVATYDYTDERGNLVFQAVRYEPKTFRQRQPDGKGGWIWNLEGVERKLFNLPKVIRSPAVIITEGEKDAVNLNKLGFCATTNVGGAGKWLGPYSDFFKHKKVIICGDNDDKGKLHVEKVIASLGNLPESVKQIKIPETFKDVSDYISSFNSFEDATAKIIELIDTAEILTGYQNLPLKTAEDAVVDYEDSNKKIVSRCFDFGAFIPSMSRFIRPLTPGDLAVIAADTGTGKSVILQNMAMAARPLSVLVFQMELVTAVEIERYISAATETTSKEVHKAYSDGKTLDWKTTGKLDHLLFCHKSGLTVARMKELTISSELKLGKRPDLVIIDYLQLIRGRADEKGGRYERFSNIAEDLKAMANDLNVMVIVASQVARDKEKKTPEVFLHDCKESGSIENSCGILFGAWRDREDPSQLFLKVLKNSKGLPGKTFKCEFDGERKLIREWEEKKPFTD